MISQYSNKSELSISHGLYGSSGYNNGSFLRSLLVFLASFTLADQLGNIICDSWAMHSATGSEKAFFNPKEALVDGFQDIWF